MRSVATIALLGGLLFAVPACLIAPDESLLHRDGAGIDSADVTPCTTCDGRADGALDAGDDTGAGDGGDTGVDAGADTDAAGGPDRDKDSIPDSLDNCPDDPNPNQSDIDGDKLGDVCDPDIDGDTLPNGVDPRPTIKDTVYYYNNGADTLDDCERLGGSWSKMGTRVCQGDYSDTWGLKLLPNILSVGDYLVESAFSVSSKDPNVPQDYWPSIGLLFRIDKANGDWDGYDCLLDLDHKRLVIGVVTNNNSDWTELGAGANNSVPSSGPYRMRVTAKGNQLTCEIVGGTKISVAHSGVGSGTAGVVADRVKGCYDYLLVTAAP
ncbi:MAG: thrombospondin type 3 repeat-containing protein [Myxococcales bacterium]|nr:thrombospondin type 3 repeat-containing protein [Myxococcales bacterium]